MRAPGFLALLAAAACGSSSTATAPQERESAAATAVPTTAQLPPPPQSPAAPASATAPTAGELDAIIARLWPDGCFTFRDAAGTLHTSNPTRCELPRRPYSTFKIANALIGVEAGLLDGPDAAMTWDKQAIPDQRSFRDAWRKPQTLRTGMAVSAVPYFRTLALQLGEERMRAGLDKLDYGNRDISGGLDRFWLSGGLRISAARQLAFVEALARDQLAVSPRTQRTVREVLALETADAATLRGKTGSGPASDLGANNPGWLVWQVGWIELGTASPAIMPYACWMETRDAGVDAARASRNQRLRATLDELALFPAPAPAVAPAPAPSAAPAR